MSLEDKIEKLTAAVEKLTEQMETVLNTDVGAAAEGEEKPKRTRRTKAEIEAEKKAAETATAEPAKEEPAAVPAAEEAKAAAEPADGMTGDELKSKLSTYLSEFPKDNPEEGVRRAKLKELIAAVGANGLNEVLADQDKIVRMYLGFKITVFESEFPENHPERTARREKLKELFGKLKAANLTEVLSDAAKVASLDKWFETKAKTWDEGHGVGRFAADPAPAAAADEMEEL